MQVNVINEWIRNELADRRQSLGRIEAEIASARDITDSTE